MALFDLRLVLNIFRFMIYALTFQLGVDALTWRNLFLRTLKHIEGVLFLTTCSGKVGIGLFDLMTNLSDV